MFHTDLSPTMRSISALVVLWVAMIVIVNPMGDFPLNDDWVYALAVKSIIETGRFSLPSTTYTNVFAQAYWGALFCWPFGFSFEALRASTLTLGLAGVLGTFAVLRLVGAPATLALGGAALLAGNPIYFGLSNTFMTDVPFYALTVLSLALLIRGIKHESTLALALGFVLCYLAILIRQFGVAVLVAYCVACLYARRISLRTVSLSIAPLALGVLIHFGFQQWMLATGRAEGFLEASSGHLVKMLRVGASEKLAKHTFVTLTYLALFIFPIAWFGFSASLGSQRAEQRRLAWVLVGVLGLAATGVLATFTVDFFPFWKNVLTRFGLGPLTLRDTYLLNTNLPVAAIPLRLLWMMLGVAAAFGAAMLVYRLSWVAAYLFRRPSPQSTHGDATVVVLTGAFGITYGFLIAISSTSMFDRYVLALYPAAAILCLLPRGASSEAAFGWRATIPAGAWIAGSIIFSVAATHDYLTWNRMRWIALNELMISERVAPSDIDGGYEFNGWFLHDKNYKEQPNKSYWWVDKDTYLVASGPVRGYERMRTYPFQRWLPVGRSEIVVLRKLEN